MPGYGLRLLTCFKLIWRFPFTLSKFVPWCPPALVSTRSDLWVPIWTKARASAALWLLLGSQAGTTSRAGKRKVTPDRGFLPWTGLPSTWRGTQLLFWHFHPALSLWGSLLFALTSVKSSFIKFLKLHSRMCHLFPAGLSLIQNLLCKTD